MRRPPWSFRSPIGRPGKNSKQRDVSRAAWRFGIEAIYIKATQHMHQAEAPRKEFKFSKMVIKGHAEHVRNVEWVDEMKTAEPKGASSQHTLRLIAVIHYGSSIASISNSFTGLS